jgi:phosphatidylglycerol:prolipoprotein diacylglycerol transferase
MLRGLFSIQRTAHRRLKTDGYRHHDRLKTLRWVVLCGNGRLQPPLRPAYIALETRQRRTAALPTFVIAFPAIDPVLIQIGPIAIRWYALAYIAGLLLGWGYLRWLVQRPGWRLTLEDLDDLLLYVVLGVVLGGRLGYVLFYKPGFYLAHPGDILAVWQGGMSFHGGMLGVIIAMAIFARRRGIAFFEIGDAVAAAVPIGLFFGRIANFINGELFGRASDVPWAMVFPHGGPEPRHPSQLYEAALEGLLLFFILYWFARRPYVPDAAGKIGGLFLIGYGLARSFVEFFREPDAHLGLLLSGNVTMGQILSLPMILIGLFLLVRSHAGSKQTRAEPS